MRRICVVKLHQYSDYDEEDTKNIFEVLSDTAWKDVSELEYERLKKRIHTFNRLKWKFNPPIEYRLEIIESVPYQSLEGLLYATDVFFEEEERKNETAAKKRADAAEKRKLTERQKKVKLFEALKVELEIPTTDS